MKRINLKFLPLSLLLLLSFCSDKDEPKPTPTPTPTSLELTVRNSLGNPINGATVKLFRSNSDFNNQANQVGSTQLTNSSGVAVFSNLEPLQYFWRIESGCLNNINNSFTSTSPLAANTKNLATVIISETGSIQFNSTSANPYRLFINGVNVGDLPGGNSAVFQNRPVGSYTLRVLQLSGFLLTPTDLTFSGNLSCGSTLIVNFP